MLTLDDIKERLCCVLLAAILIARMAILWQITSPRPQPLGLKDFTSSTAGMSNRTCCELLMKNGEKKNGFEDIGRDTPGCCGMLEDMAPYMARDASSDLYSFTNKAEDAAEDKCCKQLEKHRKNSGVAMKAAGLSCCEAWTRLQQGNAMAAGSEMLFGGQKKADAAGNHATDDDGVDEEHAEHDAQYWYSLY